MPIDSLEVWSAGKISVGQVDYVKARVDDGGCVGSRLGAFEMCGGHINSRSWESPSVGRSPPSGAREGELITTHRVLRRRSERISRANVGVGCCGLRSSHGNGCRRRKYELCMNPKFCSFSRREADSHASKGEPRSYGPWYPIYIDGHFSVTICGSRFAIGK